MMRLRFAVFAGSLALAVATTGCRVEVGEDEDIDVAIETMLDRSAAAWNAGDLDGFMESFAAGSTTSFMTGDGPIYGREVIRQAYASSFETGARRDSLRFEDLEVRMLPPLVGIVTLRYVLEREETTTASGWVTLVVRRTSDGWRIVHDHSS